MTETPIATDSGYSPPLAITLELDGQRFDVAEMGPEFVRLRGAVPISPCPATIRVEIDGQPILFGVDLFDGIDPERKRQPFRDQVVTSEPTRRPMATSA